MQQESPSEAINDFIWPAQPQARMLGMIGLGSLAAGALVLAYGLLPGTILPKIAGLDTAFLASAAVVLGLIVWGANAARAKTRRIRIDRQARLLERATLGRAGAWRADFSAAFDQIAEIRVETRDVEDEKLSFSIEVLAQDGGKTDLWPVRLPTKEAAEAALAALKGAMAGRTG